MASPPQFIPSTPPDLPVENLNPNFVASPLPNIPVNEATPAYSASLEKKILHDAQQAGVPVYHFNPDATPAQKSAQIENATPADIIPKLDPKAAPLVSDNAEEGNTTILSNPPPYSSAVPPTEPPFDDEKAWQKVGWAPRFGMPKLEGEEANVTLLDDQTYLEGKLSDKFYGDWYQNTAVIIFSCLVSWIVGMLGGGLGWILILLAFAATYYRTSIRRVRRNFRDDINREMAKNRLETDTETLEWINSFLVKFWPIYAPVLCSSIVNSVDQVLSDSKPAFLEGLRLKTFTLGSKPPRLEHVKTYPKAEDDIILMDWKFSFTPNDLTDMTSRQIKVKTNPKVVLEVRVGKGVVSKGNDIIVEDMSFSGLMRVKIKLQLAFPHIDRVEISFLERPEVDFVCKPVGGDMFGMDINFIPGLQNFILEIIHSSLAPMLYDPNVFPIEVAKMLAGNPVDQAIGVLQVTFHNAEGLKNSDKFSSSMDPYAIVSINNRTELGRTRIIHETSNPRWGETINIVVNSLKDSLTLPVCDYSGLRKDKVLGIATFPLERLEDEPNVEGEILTVLSNGKPRGTVCVDVRFFPVLEPTKLPDGTEEPPPETSTGIVRFTVEQAKDLDGSKSLVGQLNPYAVLLLNGKEVHTTKKLKRTNQPIWSNGYVDILITDRNTARLGTVIKDDRNLAADPVLGTYDIKLNVLLSSMLKGSEWFNLAGCKQGRVKMLAQWRPVALKGDISGASGYVNPIGVMRIHIIRARELNNVETFGKSDPYARVCVSGIQRARTVTVQSNLNPEWDEVFYIAVRSIREKYVVEVMDEENVGKDRVIGFLELEAQKYLKKKDDESTSDHAGNFMVYPPELLSEPLRSGSRGHTKGFMDLSVAFYPCIPVKDASEADKEVKKDGATDSSAHDAKPVANTEVPKPDDSSNTQRPISMDSAEEDAAAAPISPLSPKGSVVLSRSSLASNLEKVEITPENLKDFPCGFVVFTISDVQAGSSNSYLQILADDNAFPSYTSQKIKKSHQIIGDTGEVMIRELEFSELTLRLVGSHDNSTSADDVLAVLKGSTYETLRKCLSEPSAFTLRSFDGRDTNVTISLKYLPVDMVLDPSESFNNQGELRVNVIDGSDLPAADRNGFSDPFCKFMLNGKQVYKTNKCMKTLNPAWNENFTVQIKSCTNADFNVQVFDWDFGDKSDFLGKGDINLKEVQPFKKQTFDIPLDGKSGSVRLGLLFRPSYIVRTRQSSSTFTGTFVQPAKIVGAPIRGVEKGVNIVGGGVAKGVSFLGRGFKNRRKSRSSNEDMPDTLNVSTGMGALGNPNLMEDRSRTVTPTHELLSSPSAADTQFRNISVSGHTPSISSQAGIAPSLTVESGSLILTLVSATGFPHGINLRVQLFSLIPKGKDSVKVKEIHKTKAVKVTDNVLMWPIDSEHAKVHATTDTQFKLVAKDHSTWKSDEEIGEGVFYADDLGSSSDKVVNVGPGRIVVRTRFIPNSGNGVDDNSLSGATTANSPPRGLRKFSAMRDSMNRDRSVTPGT